MTHREPFGLGALITDFLWFLAKRAHLVLGLLCVQFLISFVLMVILGLFEFEERNSIRAFAVPISALLPLSMISAYGTSVLRWRRRSKIGWRSLLEFRLRGLFLRIVFVIFALVLTVLTIYGANFGLREVLTNQRLFLASVAGFIVLPIALGPLYLKDLFPNPWAAIWPNIKGLYKIAPGLLVFSILNLLIVIVLLLLHHFIIGTYLLTTFLSAYTPKQEHFLILQDTKAFLSIHTLIFLQLIAAAFLFERFKEITYGRDLSHVAEAF